MTHDKRWLLIKDLFGRCQQLPEDQRDTWLADQCDGDKTLMADVRRLLSAQRAAPGILAEGAVGVLRQFREERHADMIGHRIGPYRLVKLIGEGGMGSVFLAERKNGEFVQQVALKLVRPDFVNPETRARFAREHNFLARLVHPNIAQLHDGGIADETPYFTLEYVEGQAITDYCDAHQLDVRQRVELTLQVCSAVVYAHRNLIVHRDLKPSNILVTAGGDVKLLDFGIAKLLETEVGAGETATQGRMMTPEYASPEQVLGEPITTATDVYAIGVLVYELLCGRLPYARADAGDIGWAKAVIEEPPELFGRALSRTTSGSRTTTGEQVAATRATTLPALRRTLRGDLDRIVQRALAKEPEARYASVGALADDLRAFVEGRAISGGSRRYRLRKFARRHWLPLTAAAAMALIVLGSGFAVVWQAERTAREARTTVAVKDFLFGLFTGLDPRTSKGRDVKARELLDRGALRIERNHNLDADQRAEIEGALGRIYYFLGLFDQANKLQESAVQRLSETREQPLLLALTESQDAETFNELGDAKKATSLAEEAKATIDALDATDTQRVEVLHTQQRIALEGRDFNKAKQIADTELAIARKGNVETETLVRALLSAGSADWGLSDYAQSESRYREALALMLPDAADDDLEVAKARSNLAITLRGESKYAEAEALESQAIGVYEKVLGADHPVTLQVRRDLGLTYYHLGLYPQARSTFEHVLAAQRSKLGDDHPALAGTEINLGLVLIDNGDLDAAEHVLADAAAIFEKKYGHEHQGTRTALGDLAVVHTQQGKLSQAAAELDDIRTQEIKLKLPDSEGFITAQRIGEVMRLQGHATEAVEIQRKALEGAQKKGGENGRYAAGAHQLLALSLRDSGDDAGAANEFRAALAAYGSYIPNAEHPLAATTRYELGVLLVKNAQTRAEGIRLLTEAAQLREKFFGADELRTKQARNALAVAQRRQS